MSTVYDFSVLNMRNHPVSLGDYRGKVLLIVNTASRCIYTRQYVGLQACYERFRTRGFEVLAFPCNQFGKQEPGSSEQIETLCSSFRVTFPVFEKIDVNGPGASGLFEHLKGAAPGLLGTRSIKWNFTKFLVSRDGTQVRRFAPRTSPEALSDKVEPLLA